ncbi:MAG: sigma-E factor negative regulatory protein [Nevskiales bacterium]
MTDRKIAPKLDELLSAFLDGEASAEETHTLLDRLGREPGLHATLDHHHRLRASLRDELHPGLDEAFASRVLAGIDGIENTAAPHVANVVPLPRRAHPLMRTTLGLAMAASVAAVAVLTAQTLLPTTDSTFPTLTTTPDVPHVATTPTKAVAVAVDTGQHWNDLSPDAATELHHYLISHNNSAVDHGLNGTMGFMRVAADEAVDFDRGSR